MEHVIGGRYRLQGLLGRGGMADVHRALDRTTGGLVAVKVFRDCAELVDADRAGAERRRRHEVEVLAALDHPGLVRLLDADVSDGSLASGRSPYIVTELVEGASLRSLVYRGPFHERDVAAVGAHLAEALDHVHGRGIVHRDVKPANVLVPDVPHERHAAKLADFGVARIIGSARLTGEGLTVGTANYLSPEQVTSAPVGPPSDVYSLGLVLIEALTGQPVYRGRGIEVALRRLTTAPVLPAGVDPFLAAALTEMTARDPQRRPSAREAAQQLAAVAEPSLASDLLALGGPQRDRGRPAARHRRPSRWRRRRPEPVQLVAAGSVVLDDEVPRGERHAAG